MKSSQFTANCVNQSTNFQNSFDIFSSFGIKFIYYRNILQEEVTIKLLDGIYVLNL
jgi:hypothetical protein